MTEYQKGFLSCFTGVLIAIIWGYFADLRNGRVGWFMARIILVLAIQFIFIIFTNKKEVKIKSR